MTKLKNFSQLIEELDQLTDKEARLWFEQNKKMGLLGALGASVGAFIAFYFNKRCNVNGVQRLFLAVNKGMFQFLSYAKLWEIKNKVSQK